MFILTTFLKTLHQKYLRSMASQSTRVLNCDSSAVTFHPTSHRPDVTCRETLDALKIASYHLVDKLECVAFPTETVYGLGAVALNSVAVARIFSAKGRPPDNPLIIHVSSFTMLNSILPTGYNLPKVYQILMKHFWPGALTLLFPRDPDLIPDVVTANQPTVAIRMPSHPIARALIAIANTPLAAPSANSSGKPSPTRAEHVLHDLDTKINIILDGGMCGVGLESTVIDGLHEDGNIRILRPGGVTVEDIEKTLQEEWADSDCIPKVLVYRRDYSDESQEMAPTTPGMKYRHYSPSVPVTLLLTKSLPADKLAVSASAFFMSLKRLNKILKVGILAPVDSSLWDSVVAMDGLEWYRFPLGPSSQPTIIAHRLFDGLLTLEERGVDLMLIEEVAEEREGLAVMNRVRKAANDVRWLTP